MDFYFTMLLISLVVYVGYQHWLAHLRRVLVHRERLAAVEKGIELPRLEHEVERRSWNVQRLLLLCGLIWISLGIGAFVVLSALLANPSELTREIPAGVQWVGIAPVGIGISHLIVYWAGSRRD